MKNSKPRPSRRQRLEALMQANEDNIGEQIRRLLAQPMSARTHFLRRRLPWGGSAL